MYWLNLLNPTGNLPVWYEYMLSTSSSRSSLTLMIMSPFFFLDIFLCQPLWHLQGLQYLFLLIVNPKGSSAYSIYESLLNMESASVLPSPWGLAMIYNFPLWCNSAMYYWLGTLPLHGYIELLLLWFLVQTHCGLHQPVGAVLISLQSVVLTPTLFLCLGFYFWYERHSSQLWRWIFTSLQDFLIWYRHYCILTIINVNLLFV